jgi:Fic family protein
MSYQSRFTITLPLLARVEGIAALRERIQGATVQVPWIPALQKDTRARNTHSSTAVEGNPLTLEEVRALEEGATVAAPAREKVVLRPRQEQLLKLLGQSGGMTPAELWAALNVSKQGAMDLLRPLLKAGLVQRVGTLKTGRYLLK